MAAKAKPKPRIEADWRTDALADKLVEGISDGIPLRQLCRENNVSKSAVYQWINEDEKLKGRIACARIEGYDALAEETLEIVDNVREHHASRRVRAETRLKLLAKWYPTKYGERIDHTSSDGSMSPKPLSDFYQSQPQPDQG